MPKRANPQSDPPTRGRPPDTKKRERLLDAATELFAERGIANTTVAQIAASAQVTSAMVHYWFETRDKLLDAIVDERMAPILNEIWEHDKLKPQNITELLQGFVTRMFEATRKRPWLPALWLREIIQDGGLLRERWFSHLPRDRNIAIRNVIGDAQDKGEINPEILPDLLFITMVGLVMLPQAVSKSLHRLNPDIAVEHGQLERHVMALLTNGITGGIAKQLPKKTVQSRRSKQ